MTLLDVKRVLIADDHPMVSFALAQAVEAAFGTIDIEAFDEVDALMDRLEAIGSADMVLLDLRMPGVQGFDSLIALRARYPETPVVIVSGLADPALINETLALGAVGFIPKSMPRAEILDALRTIAAGAIHVPADRPRPRRALDPGEAGTTLAGRVASLTGRQREVLRLLGMGKLNKQIAYELAIAETTVKIHVSAILHKLKVYSRTQAVVLAGRLQLNEFDAVPPPWPDPAKRPVLRSPARSSARAAAPA